jgi:hypothetical protein
MVGTTPPGLSEFVLVPVEGVLDAAESVTSPGSDLLHGLIWVLLEIALDISQNCLHDCAVLHVISIGRVVF